MPAVENLVPSPELRAEFERWATTLFKSKGTALFGRGDDAIGVFFVRSGRICLGLDCETPLYPARLCGPGTVIGLPATLSGKPYSLSATVVEDAELAFVPRHRVVACLKMKSLLCFEVMAMLSEEISDIRSAVKGYTGSGPKKNGKRISPVGA